MPEQLQATINWYRETVEARLRGLLKDRDGESGAGLSLEALVLIGVGEHRLSLFEEVGFVDVLVRLGWPRLVAGYCGVGQLFLVESVGFRDRGVRVVVTTVGHGGTSCSSRRRAFCRSRSRTMSIPGCTVAPSTAPVGSTFSMRSLLAEYPRRSVGLHPAVGQRRTSRVRTSASSAADNAR